MELRGKPPCSRPATVQNIARTIMGSGWSSDTSSECSEHISEPYKHLVAKDDGAIASNTKYDTATLSTRSPSQGEQPKPYTTSDVDTAQETTEDLTFTKDGVSSGNCAWSIDISDWAGKKKKLRSRNRPKAEAGRHRSALVVTEPGCDSVESAPPLLPVVVLQDDEHEAGKLASSPEDLSQRKCLDLKRW